MQKLKSAVLGLLFFFGTTLQAHNIQGEALVSVHGFLGASWNMIYLTSGYSKEGVKVIHWDYPSRFKKIQDHGADLAHKLQSLAKKSPGVPINFITHSMGGLVLRAAVNHPDCPPEAKMGKAVLLAPPNQGACWGRFLSEIAIAQKTGRNQAGKQLMTEEDFEFLGQFPEAMEVCVIAGNSTLNPFIEGENDGTVAVAETHLSTPHSHFVINTGHKRILFSEEAHKLAKEFFSKESN